MKGATADPWDKMIKAPRRNKTIKIGIIQYFFLSKINCMNSFKNDIFY